MAVSRVRAGAGLWCGIALVCLAYSITFSSLAPGGRWENRIFESELSSEHDPGGFYLPSAHQMFQFDRRPLFPGHPGTTLQLWLYGIQRAHYALAAPSDLSFTAFTARHLASVYVVSKVSITLLHLLSFYLLYRLARRLTNERASVLAVLGYATSLPVLYFLSRISVEPLMIIFFVATLLALANALDAARDDRGGASTGFSALAGVLAISGAATKLNFLGPLPFFGLLYLIAGLGLRDASGQWRLPVRARLAGAFILTSIFTAFAYLQLIHLGDLIRAWTMITQGARVLFAWNLEQLLPGANAQGAFQLCEFLFIAVAIVGWVRYLRRPSPQRAEASWLSLYIVFALLLWVLRVAWLDFRAFLYFTLASAGLAVFFGFMADRILQRLGERIPAAAGWWGVWVLMALVHGASLVVATESRIDDTRQFQGGPVFELAATLGPEDRIHVLRSSAPERLRSGFFEGSLGAISGLRSLDDAPAYVPPIHPMSCPIHSDRDITRCSSVPPLLHSEFNALVVLVSKPPSEGGPARIVPGLGRTWVVRSQPE